MEEIDGIRMKVVGRRRTPMTPEQALKWNFEVLKLAPADVRHRPRGVFRFKTWEEVDAWDRNLIAQAGNPKSRRERDRWDREVLQSLTRPEPGQPAGG